MQERRLVSRMGNGWRREGGELEKVKDKIRLDESRSRKEVREKRKERKERGKELENGKKRGGREVGGCEMG